MQRAFARIPNQAWSGHTAFTLLWPLKRDEIASRFSSCSNMNFLENRYTLFRIMPWRAAR
jgi:hypothetical protein